MQIFSDFVLKCIIGWIWNNLNIILFSFHNILRIFRWPFFTWYKIIVSTTILNNSVDYQMSSIQPNVSQTYRKIKFVYDNWLNILTLEMLRLLFVCKATRLLMIRCFISFMFWNELLQLTSIAYLHW